MDFDLVVFDIAGTVVADDDDAVGGALRDALMSAGIEVSLAEIDPLMGTPKPAAVRKLLAAGRGASPAEDEVERVHDDFRRRIVEHYRTSSFVREIAGATDVLRQLRKAGIRVALDTGFDRATVDVILDRLGWDVTVVDDTVASDEVANGRPSPDMIEVLMARAGVADPARVAKVGDSVSDVEQGIAAGCGLTVAIRGRRTEPVLARYPQVVGIDSVADVPDVLGVTP